MVAVVSVTASTFTLETVGDPSTVALPVATAFEPPMSLIVTVVVYTPPDA
jgi:hypothetical protein